MRTPAVLAAALLLAGCSLVVGGSGEFSVEGHDYRAGRVTCFRGDGVLTLNATDGPAGMTVILSDAPAPVVREVRMGVPGQDMTLSMDAEGKKGRAEATRTEDTFRVRGVVLHTAASQNAPEGSEEPFEFTLTCGRVVDA